MDLSKLSLGERIVTLSRLLAAEHVRQEVESIEAGEVEGEASPSPFRLPFADARPIGGHETPAWEREAA